MIVCDFHVHLGTSKDGGSLSVEGLLAAMKMADVRHAVIFPFDEREVGDSYEVYNRQVREAAKAHPELIPFCRVYPPRRKAALKEMEACYKAGSRGIKLHPRSDHILSNTVDDILKRAGEYRWPVIMHISHEENCHPRAWERSFKRFRNVKFILGHAGKDSYMSAARVAVRCPNVFLDTSTLSLNRTRRIMSRAGADRILFGSDQPYSHMAIERKKFELMTDDEERTLVFEENAYRIFPELRRG